MNGSLLAPLKERFPRITKEIDRVITFLNDKASPFEINLTHFAQEIKVKEILALAILGECQDLGLVTALRYEFYCRDNPDKGPFVTAPDLQFIKDNPLGFCAFDESLHELGYCPSELYFIFNP